MKRCLLVFAALALPFFSVYAHIGSPDVALQGMAGPYHLLVNIKPPDVIPGTATVTVFIQNGDGANVYTQPIYFYSGKNGAPSADRLQPAEGQPGQFNGTVWLMTDGSSSILLSVTGSLGKGELVVPIVAISTAQKKLPAAIGYSLAILGLILFILMVTIIGASVGEGITRRGEALTPGRKRSKRIAFGMAALFSSLIVYGGNAWWKSSARIYSQFMFKPMHASYLVTSKDDGSNLLTIRIATLDAQRRSTLSYLVPDHGKLMHLYIMRMPAMDVIAHLHPVRIDSATFITTLPPLPAGRYLTYADIVYNTGFTETMKDELTIGRDLTDSLHRMDPDNAYAIVPPLDNDAKDPRKDSGKPGTGSQMKDGSTMMLEGLPAGGFESGALYTLQFAVYDANKQPAALTPYMGMMGHAAIVRNDGSVFVHIHPVGTYSVAAQQNLLSRMGQNVSRYQAPDRVAFRDSIDRLVSSIKGMTEMDRNAYLMKEMGMAAGDSVSMGSMSGMSATNNKVSFPYNFPQPGWYRIWVQVKKNGQVLTAAFDQWVR